ncbi:pimeloyl-ACP methyl ester carboxylesterase [Kineococcus radiotolerans]|uniref:Pimeloyl-ACP methyl ester carboxylesterase n=1 Tax=Kineococcus radiotolerans TaxID=131568 RepID=A0A7W4XZK1_KINRA|nr:alpha/beta fold hydrolase [Kineococcus radiotolerans]MBB2903364.1 pimeloyl-ACP methyl ester carboxylesterase [Kineococcus radiotolerans]
MTSLPFPSFSSSSPWAPAWARPSSGVPSGVTDRASIGGSASTPGDAAVRVPVVFIPGLWIHSTAWQPWVDLFTAAGYAASAPGWPGQADTVEATRAHPAAMAGWGIDDITERYARYLTTLVTLTGQTSQAGQTTGTLRNAQAFQIPRPILIGHSFGGLVAQKLLARGAAAAAVAIDPAPIKGVRALPLAQIRSALPVLRKKANAEQAVALTRRQFRYAFANAVSRAEADDLYARWAVPGPGRPIFELTAAKKDLAGPTQVPTDDGDRGPLLILGGGRDHTVPEVVARQAAKLYRPGRNTEYRKLNGRGHSLVFDSGWHSLAETVLTWVDGTQPLPGSIGGSSAHLAGGASR